MAYEPDEYENKIKCPMIEMKPCLGKECAWFMILQKACAINVLARLHGILKGDKIKVVITNEK